MDTAAQGGAGTELLVEGDAASTRRPRQRIDVFGSALDAIDLETAVSCIAAWADDHAHRVVCATNVHSVIAARGNRELTVAISIADMAVPDGAPVAWRMRLSGRPSQRRIAGPDLMWAYLQVAADRCQSIFLLGGSDETLAALQVAIRQRFPRLVVAGAYSPPFRSLTDAEDDAIVARINASGAGTVWVGLGCPKQELWMAAHRDRIQAVQIGVGAAFDFHAGVVRRAPLFMQRAGFEWLHRLVSEPRRLWRRYAVTGSRFAGLCALEAIRRQLARLDQGSWPRDEPPTPPAIQPRRAAPVPNRALRHRGNM